MNDQILNGFIIHCYKTYLLPKDIFSICLKGIDHNLLLNFFSCTILFEIITL